MKKQKKEVKGRIRENEVEKRKGRTERTEGWKWRGRKGETEEGEGAGHTHSIILDLHEKKDHNKKKNQCAISIRRTKAAQARHFMGPVRVSHISRFHFLRSFMLPVHPPPPRPPYLALSLPPSAQSLRPLFFLRREEKRRNNVL